MNKPLTREEVESAFDTRRVGIHRRTALEMALKATIDAERVRAEQAERERDEAKEVFELALREKGWAKALTDAYAERDALRAEAGRLREALIGGGFVVPGLGVGTAGPPLEAGSWGLSGGRSLSSTPLSALDRTEER